MARATIPKPIVEDVLTKSARRCALCFGLDGSLARKKGQIAHIDRDHANAALGNLAYLCLEHHDEYDSKTSQSKGIVPGEVILYRDRLYELIVNGEHHRKAAVPKVATAVPANVLNHDRGVFRLADGILSESLLRIVLDRFESDHACTSYGARLLDRFREHLSLESNKFVLEDLQHVADELHSALTDLDDFATAKFFPFPEKQDLDDDRRYCMQPNWNIDRGGTGAPEDVSRYAALENELLALTARVRSAYAEYRRSVKRTLLV